MLYATQTDFVKPLQSFNSPRDAHSRPSEERLIGIRWINDERVDRTEVDSELTKIKMPVYPTGLNLNNPTLPSQLMRSPLAKRFELPPTTTIGIVDEIDKTISLAPPVHECLTPLKYTPRWTKGKGGFISSHANRNLSVPRGSNNSPTFLITSPSLLNKALVRNQKELGELHFVSNYHVPKQNQLNAIINASHIK